MVACVYREGDTVMQDITPILVSSTIKRTRSKVIKREAIGKFKDNRVRKLRYFFQVWKTNKKLRRDLDSNQELQMKEIACTWSHDVEHIISTSV
jgi:hypothetical protein